MAVLAGIDEAGFGPILGPLVVSASVFEVPKNLVWGDLWQILRGSISDKRTGLKGRLLIADSKKAFSKSVGVRHLRRTVLAVLKHLGIESKNLNELILSLCPDCLEHLSEYPWYNKVNDYSLGGDNGDIAIGASMLKKDLAEKHIELLGLKSRCLEVARYNRMVSEVKNKAKVLFTAVAELMQWAIKDFAGDDLEIVIDRQGGRSHYRRQLQMMFPDMALRVIREDVKRSSYELADRDRRIRVHFIVGADGKFLPVALASMTSKYIREVLVDNINGYFMGFNGSLKPTAGYWKDGLRFIEDIKTYIPNVHFNANQLIRCR
jgi:ribonuclease HII